MDYKEIEFDIDIDVTSDVDKNQYGIPAMMNHHHKILPHPNGVYIEKDKTIPIDPVTGLCSIPYKLAFSYNLLKIDILHNTSYDIFESKEELLYYQNKKVDWDSFIKSYWIEKLPQIHNHVEFVQQIQPCSVHDLSDLLALMRPAKKSLTEQYIRSQSNTIQKQEIRKQLYRRPTNGKMHFKKSHSYAYASMIISIFNKLQAMEQSNE